MKDFLRKARFSMRLWYLEQLSREAASMSRAHSNIARNDIADHLKKGKR